jgi:hypothetical protein
MGFSEGFSPLCADMLSTRRAKERARMVGSLLNDFMVEELMEMKSLDGRHFLLSFGISFAKFGISTWLANKRALSDHPVRHSPLVASSKRQSPTPILRD